jgi:hypothetical protein
MGLLEDLAAALQAASIGTVSFDLFVGRLPDLPHAAMAIYQYAGLPPLYTHQSLIPSHDRPSVQVRARDVDFAAVETRIREAYVVLCGLTDYLACQPLQPPFQLDRDAHDRQHWAVNFSITVALAEGG